MCFNKTVNFVLFSEWSESFRSQNVAYSGKTTFASHLYSKSPKVCHFPMMLFCGVNFTSTAEVEVPMEGPNGRTAESESKTKTTSRTFNNWRSLHSTHASTSDLFFFLFLSVGKHYCSLKINPCLNKFAFAHTSPSPSSWKNSYWDFSVVVLRHPPRIWFNEIVREFTVRGACARTSSEMENLIIDFSPQTNPHT